MRIGMMMAAGAIFTTAALLASGEAWAGPGVSSGYLYYRPGTNVPYYNYFLPSSRASCPPAMFHLSRIRFHDLPPSIRVQLTVRRHIVLPPPRVDTSVKAKAAW